VSRRTSLVLACTSAACLSFTGIASAHVQVEPRVAAPDDAVRFSVLVPNERSAGTVEVSLKVPPGVLPFSYERTAGWTRTLARNPDGSIDVIRWRGRLDSDGFVTFSFLASTPPQAGIIEWKAIQLYDDGKQSAWIGKPDSGNPAPVTSIEKDAPRANAGGESSEGDRPGTGDASPSAGSDGSGSGSGRFAAGLGAAALLMSVAALAVALRRRP